MIANGGFEVAFHGENRETVPDERIVTTEVSPGMEAGMQEQFDALGACQRSRHARMRPSTLRRIGRRTLVNTSVLTTGPSTARLG
jgi:hypothetical protein